MDKRYIIEDCVACKGEGFHRYRSKLKLPCLICEESGKLYLNKKNWHNKYCKDKSCKDLVHSDLVFAVKGVLKT